MPAPSVAERGAGAAAVDDEAACDRCGAMALARLRSRRRRCSGRDGAVAAHDDHVVEAAQLLAIPAVAAMNSHSVAAQWHSNVAPALQSSVGPVFELQLSGSSVLSSHAIDATTCRVRNAPMLDFLAKVIGVAVKPVMFSFFGG